MKCCWGCNALIPYDLVEYIPTGMSYSIAHQENYDVDILLVAGIDGLRRIWQHVKVRDLAVVVFDAQVYLDQWGIPELVLETRQMRKAFSETNHIKYNKSNSIDAMLRNLVTSFIGNFSTYSYKQKDAVARALLKKTVMEALYSGTTVRLAGKLPEKNVELRNLLSSPACVLLEAALQEVKSGKSVAEAAKSKGVSVFDIDYVMRSVK